MSSLPRQRAQFLESDPYGEIGHTTGTRSPGASGMKISHGRRGIVAISATCALLSATAAACGGGSDGGGGGGGGGTAKAKANPICPDPTAPAATAQAPNTTLSGKVTLWGWTNDAPKAVLTE